MLSRLFLESMPVYRLMGLVLAVQAVEEEEEEQVHFAKETETETEKGI